MSGLPEGWASIDLARAVEPDAPIIYGILQPGPEMTDGVPYVRPTEIVDDVIDTMALRRTSPEIALRYDRSSLAPGDVLLSIVGTIGKVAVVPEELAGGNITQSSCRVRASRSVTSAQFVANFLRSPAARSQFEEARLGTAVPRLNLEDVRKIEMPLPPLPEQQRMLAKIDSLTSKSRRVRDHLDHIPRLVEKYKQAVLAAAFRGDLTDCRGIHSAPLADFIHALDQGWSPKCEPEPAGPGEWAVIKTTAIQAVGFFPAENKRLPQHLSPRPDITIHAGDVLITRAGPRSRVAVSCVVLNDHPRLMLCDKAYRLRVDHDRTDPVYLTYMLNSPQCLDVLEAMKTGISDSGLNLTQGKFLELQIPALPKEAQLQVVDRVHKAFKWIDLLASEITSARTLVDRLDQAVLAKAFRGELVPQDPTDEPASVLLARIKAESDALPKAKRKQKATTE